MGSSRLGQPNNITLFNFIGLLALAICVGSGTWIYRLYTKRSLHLADFQHLSTEAKALAQETARIRNEVIRDGSSDADAKGLNMARINAADDLDNGIRMALCAWEDIMQPDEGEAMDEEVGRAARLGKRERRRMRERRKNHGRYVIGLMREKCIEGIEKRRELSPGLQAIHSETLARNGKSGIRTSGDDRRSTMARRYSTPKKAVMERIRSLTHASPLGMNEKDGESVPPSSSSSTTPCLADIDVRHSISRSTGSSSPPWMLPLPVPRHEDGTAGPARKEYTFT